MRRAFRYFLPLIALFVIVGMLRVLEAATTLSGLVTLPSPTQIMGGPMLSGQPLRLGESIVSTFDPRVSGFARPVGSLLYTRDGTKSYVKTGTTSTSWELLGPGATTGGVGRAGATSARAAQLTGIPATTFTCFRDEMVYNPSGAAGAIYTSLLGGTGSLLPVTSTEGGQEQVSSGAAASGTAILATNATVLGAPGSRKFYVASRWAGTTAVDAQTFMVSGAQVTGFGSAVNLGICGNSSTTTYVLQYDGTDCAGTFLTTGVAYGSGTFHIFELWGLGDGRLHAAVDQTEIAGSPVTPGAFPVVSLALEMDVRNGTTATTRSARLDWWQACWAEP